MQLNPLNPQQQLIVNHVIGPLLVMAPVGTGKTLVLTRRIARAMSQGISPESILCVTFTNKAANEMKERVQLHVPGEAKDLRVMTFHGFCAYILRTEAKKIGVDTDHVIYDEQDSIELLREIVKEEGSNLEEKEIKDIYYQIERAKSNAPVAKLSLKSNPDLSYTTQDGGLIKVIEKYHIILAERHALDFADLVFKVRSIFYLVPGIKDKWASQYGWIQVDEIQDTHHSEYDVISQLAMQSRNIAFFGDIDQTIYEWRGSDPFKIVERFKKDFDPVKELNLQVNYRSTKILLQAASSLAESFQKRWTTNVPDQAREEGSLILVHYEKDKWAEAKWIGNHIQKLGAGQKNFQYHKVGILTRTNQAGSLISQQFEAMKIPHVTVEEYEFFRRQEIKDALAYLKILLNPHDTNSLHRILLRPRKGIGDATIEYIRQTGKTVGLRLTDLVLQKTFSAGEPYGDLIDSFLKGNIIILDVETTGLSPLADEVVEIAAIKIARGALVEKFHKYIKNSIPVGISERVHGHSDQFLSKHGEAPSGVFEQFKQFLGLNLVVGHNVAFDVRLVSGHASRVGVGIDIRNWEDTLDISRRFLTGLERYDLRTLANALNLPNKPTHKAMDDVECTCDLLSHLIGLTKKGADPRRKIAQDYEKLFHPIARALESWRGQIKIKRPLEVLETVLEESGLNEFYQKEEKRILHINELRQIFGERDHGEADPYSSLLELINFTALAKNIDHLSKNDNRIPIITIHQAKGLEFDTVFIAGATDGEIPHYYSVNEGRIEEERRLFYVAMTRAKRELIISGYQQNQWGYLKRPSLFVQQIERKTCKVI